MNEEKEFNIGDSVWWANYANKQIPLKCTVCYGKKEVVLVLGNKDRIKVPCDFCRRGFDDPSGYVSEYKFVNTVKKVVIDRKEVNETEDGRDVEYRYTHYIVNDQIFRTKKEADKKVKEMIEKRKIEEQEKLENGKSSNHKSYSWHVGYHLERAKKAKEELKYHKSKATYMRKKAKL